MSCPRSFLSPIYVISLSCLLFFSWSWPFFRWFDFFFLFFFFSFALVSNVATFNTLSRTKPAESDRRCSSAPAQIVPKTHTSCPALSVGKECASLSFSHIILALPLSSTLFNPHAHKTHTIHTHEPILSHRLSTPWRPISPFKDSSRLLLLGPLLRFNLLRRRTLFMVKK